MNDKWNAEEIAALRDGFNAGLTFWKIDPRNNNVD